MKINSLHLKKTSFTVLSSFLLLASFSAVAQIPGSSSSKPKKTTSEGSGKSVYDVIPGSGPKKTTQPSGSGKSVYDVVPGSGPKKTSANHPHGTKGRDHDQAHHNKKVKPLPPGQAKKIYGGSATDYAPGQVKKKEGHENGNGQEQDDDKQNHHDKEGGKNHDD